MNAFMSVEAYLRSEEQSTYKREYVGGFLYPLHGSTRAQAGTTAAHIRICRNITAATRLDCDLFQSDMKLRAQATDNFYSPDVMAVCSPHRPAGDATFVTSPCLLIEVKSHITAQNDRRAKHAAYTAIPSVQTCLIAEQTTRRVTVYQRAGERWEAADLIGSGTVALPCLGTELTLDQIYRGQEFGTDAASGGPTQIQP